MVERTEKALGMRNNAIIRRTASGFTVMELMLALVIMAVVFATVTVPIANLVNRKATAVATDEFISSHSLARSTAVRYGRIGELHLDAANGRFWVQVDTGAVGGAVDTVGYVKDLASDGVTLTSDRSLLCFDSRGLPTTRSGCQSADGTIIFSTPGNADTVTITALGKVLR